MAARFRRDARGCAAAVRRGSRPGAGARGARRARPGADGGPRRGGAGGATVGGGRRGPAFADPAAAAAAGAGCAGGGCARDGGRGRSAGRHRLGCRLHPRTARAGLAAGGSRLVVGSGGRRAAAAVGRRHGRHRRRPRRRCRRARRTSDGPAAPTGGGGHRPRGHGGPAARCRGGAARPLAGARLPPGGGGRARRHAAPVAGRPVGARRLGRRRRGLSRTRAPARRLAAADRQPLRGAAARCGGGRPAGGRRRTRVSVPALGRVRPATGHLAARRRRGGRAADWQCRAHRARDHRPRGRSRPALPGSCLGPAPGRPGARQRPASRRRAPVGPRPVGGDRRAARLRHDRRRHRGCAPAGPRQAEAEPPAGRARAQPARRGRAGAPERRGRPAAAEPCWKRPGAAHRLARRRRGPLALRLRLAGTARLRHAA